jgi:D-alanine-D-alanine ligase
MKKNIALVAGGFSGEHVISIKSAATIAQNINTDLYNVYTIIIEKNSWYTLQGEQRVEVNKDNFTITINGELIKFDLVFFAIHGTPGEDGKLQGYFDILGIPYTGCGSIASAITFNKIYCNRIVASADIARVAPSIHLFKDRCPSDEEILKVMQFPMFIKPVEGGSSLGTSKVKSPEELRPAINAAFEHDTQVMAESFIPGRECTIGVYKVNGEVIVLPITEITTTNEFFDYEAKYNGKSTEITPADIPAYMQYKIEDSAKRIYNLLNCKGVVRVDFIFDLDNETLHFLEINTMPGQSEASIIPQQVRASGGNLKDFYNTLINQVLNSHL